MTLALTSGRGKVGYQGRVLTGEAHAGEDLHSRRTDDGGNRHSRGHAGHGLDTATCRPPGCGTRR